MKAKLDKLLQLGNQIKIVYQPHEAKKTRVIHIRAIVDLQMYVFCWYSKRSGWSYDVQPLCYFETIQHRLEYVGVDEEYSMLDEARNEKLDM